MIKIAITPEMTNSYVPEGWKLTDEPYKAYRAKNQEYSVTLNIAKDFDETKPSKIIKTKKGIILLVNCPEKEDEKIMLLTLRGCSQAGFYFLCNNIEVILADEYTPSFSDKNCPVQDLVVRFNDDKSKLILRTGDKTYWHFNKSIIITWDKIFREDDYPLNTVLPKNGEVIKGAAFTKNYNKGEIEVVEKVANEISSFGLGVLINTYCLYGEVIPELLFMKDGNLDGSQTITCYWFDLDKYSEDISRIKKHFA